MRLYFQTPNGKFTPERCLLQPDKEYVHLTNLYCISTVPGAVLEGKKDKALPSNGETQTATCKQIRISDSDRVMEEKNNIK